MHFAILLIISGSALLAFGADRFITGASVIAKNLGISPLVIGIVLVGFATSLPEMLVSAMASIHGKAVLAMGNAVGSNITNIGLAIGIAALVRPLQVHSSLLYREFPILLSVMLVVLLLIVDGFLSRTDGFIMVGMFVAVIVWMTHIARSKKYQQDALAKEANEVIPEKMSTGVALFWWLFGMVLLLVSSRMLVIGSISIAKHFGVSDLVIGLTIVALGTSLPEIAAAVASTLKNEPDIVIGNVIGSNLFNLLPVMIMPALIEPSKVPKEYITFDYAVMIVMTIVLFIFSVGVRGKGRINRLEGALLILAYLAYIVYLYSR